MCRSSWQVGAIAVCGAVASLASTPADGRAPSADFKSGTTPALDHLWMPVPAGATVAHQGTVANIGHCRVGVASVGMGSAVLATFRDDAAEETEQPVRKGQLLVACGAVHRILGFSHEGGNGLPGGSGDAVIIELRPRKRPRLHPGSIVLTLGGDVSRLGGKAVFLENLTISNEPSRPSVRLTVRISDIATIATGAVGDAIAIGGRRHRILAIARPNAATGVPGWVEIDPVPTAARTSGPTRE